MEMMMNILLFASILLPLFAAAAVYAVRRKGTLREALCVAASSLTLALSILSAAFGGQCQAAFVCGVGAQLKAGGAGSLLSVLSAFLFTLSSLTNRAYFASEARVGRYEAFLLVTLGAMQGVFLSADLFTCYLFFEIMSLSSWVFVAQNETPGARRAADTYLFIALFGGLAMLYGLVRLDGLCGTLRFDALLSAATRCESPGALLVAALCLTVGFGAKAGMFPLHVWLPKAHPVAPAPASALLSGILTKAGIFGILLLGNTCMAGSVPYAYVLLGSGVITMVLGALLALFSIDLKRTLACSSLSQIGFILTALSVAVLGGERALATDGALMHVLNHALIKLVLFTCAGCIYKARHTLDLNALKGAGRGNALLACCFAVGALSIAGVPLFSGFASKTVMHEAISALLAVSGGSLLWRAVEGLFLLSGGLTLAYMGKLFYKLFIEKGDSAAPAVRLDAATAAALALPTLLLIALGLAPNKLFGWVLAYLGGDAGTAPLALAVFSCESLKGAAISLFIGLAVYGLGVRFALTNRDTGAYRQLTLFDLEDSFYRPLLAALRFALGFAARLAYSLGDWVAGGCGFLLFYHAPRRVRAGRDEHFAHYSRQYVRMGKISQTLAFELMLFGVGVVLTLVYVLLF